MNATLKHSLLILTLASLASCSSAPKMAANKDSAAINNAGEEKLDYTLESFLVERVLAQGGSLGARALVKALDGLGTEEASKAVKLFEKSANEEVSKFEKIKIKGATRDNMLEKFDGITEEEAAKILAAAQLKAASTKGSEQLSKSLAAAQANMEHMNTAAMKSGFGEVSRSNQPLFELISGITKSGYRDFAEREFAIGKEVANPNTKTGRYEFFVKDSCEAKYPPNSTSRTNIVKYADAVVSDVKKAEKLGVTTTERKIRFTDCVSGFELTKSFKGMGYDVTTTEGKATTKSLVEQVNKVCHTPASAGAVEFADVAIDTYGPGIEEINIPQTCAARI